MPARRVKIRFYRLEPRLIRDDPWPGGLFPVDEVRDLIAMRSTSNDRYVQVKGDTYLGMLGDDNRPGHSCFSVYRVRHDDLPDEERAGEISPLDLPDDSNIAEGTHAVVFPRNVIGLCIKWGAGPSRLNTAAYLERLLADRDRSVLITPILRPDVMQLLEHAELTSATIRVQAGHVDALSEISNDAQTAADRLLRQSSSDSIEITLRAGRGVSRRDAFTTRVIDMLRRARERRTEFEALRVEYLSEDTGPQIVNLLGDDITVFQEVNVPVDRRHTPASEGYSAVIGAYREVLDQIDLALALG